MAEKNSGAHLCPICGKFEFDEENSLDLCENCNWRDDGLYTDNHDYCGGGGLLSFNQAKEAYKRGEIVQ